MIRILNAKGFTDSILLKGYESARVVGENEVLVDGEMLSVAECIDIIQGKRKKEVKVEDKPKRKRETKQEKKEID